MKNIFMLIILFAVACGSTNVQRLNLRDPRLPLEARRWLADAEDEVAIARARVDDAERVLATLNEYREDLLERLEDSWAKGGSTGEKAAQAFFDYVEKRVLLAELELDLAEQSRELAKKRLTQARAETAMRYDIAVYEIQTIVQQVETKRNEIAAAQKQVENMKIEVENAAGEVWKDYRSYVNKGGVSNALWGSR
jgi:Mg2+ and Co2+ transporter CorA